MHVGWVHGARRLRHTGGTCRLGHAGWSMQVEACR